MPITDWPLEQRPREKLLSHGAGSLSDAELLAIFLRTGVAGKTALDLAHDLLSHFKDIRGLLEAGLSDFSHAKGVGSAKYAQLQAVLELSRRYLDTAVLRGETLSSPQITRTFLKMQLQPELSEVFACIFLDNKHRVIQFERLFFGTIDGASVHPREVLRKALSHNAAALIFAHNHPSGVAEPSQADISITQRLKEALGLIDVRVLDHFVVGDGEPVSFAERGLL